MAAKGMVLIKPNMFVDSQIELYMKTITQKPLYFGQNIDKSFEIIATVTKNKAKNKFFIHKKNKK